MPGADELAAVVLYYAPNGRWTALLLKFRDLNSSASVVLGERCVCGCLGRSGAVCNRLQGLYGGCAEGGEGSSAEVWCL